MSAPDFPDLIPSSRTFTHGRFPATVWNGARGAAAAVRQGIGSHEHRLGLTYLGLSMAEGAVFRVHFNQALSTYDTFDLPAVVWAGSPQLPAGFLRKARWPPSRTETR